MKAYRLFAIGCCAFLAISCVGSSGAGGGTGASPSASSSGASSSGAASSGASSSGAAPGSGDSTKNTASIKAVDDAGKEVDVKVDKEAAKSDADKGAASKNGAQNLDKELIIWLSSGDSSSANVIELHINTEKHQLPKKGIKLGAALSDAWATYTVTSAAGGGVYESDGTGTVDITTCPDKEGVAVVGTFQGVKVVGKAIATGPKHYVLDGAFNAVYFGGAAALNCAPPASSSSGGATSGGTTSGGTSSGGNSSGGGNVGFFKTPKNATCDATACDNGTNISRNCCPWLPCMDKSYLACLGELETCVKACGDDFACFGKCAATAQTCMNEAPTKCGASAQCKTAMDALMTCSKNNDNACEETAAGDDAKKDVCLFDKCCNEFKAAL